MRDAGGLHHDASSVEVVKSGLIHDLGSYNLLVILIISQLFFHTTPQLLSFDLIIHEF